VCPLPLDTGHAGGGEPRAGIRCLKDSRVATEYFGQQVPGHVTCHCMPPTVQGVLEAREQIRRLSHHASVAVWGGGNEIEASFDW
jgi:hypothetical protein